MPTKTLFRTTAGLFALAAATVFTWWAWLGRDTTVTLDPATGDYSGPYTTAQVAGAVLTPSPGGSRRCPCSRRIRHPTRLL